MDSTGAVSRRSVLGTLGTLALVFFAPLDILAVSRKGSGSGPSSKGGSTSVRGHTRRDGTYVAPHHRTNPDGNRSNNWSTKGNQNPYTGKPGTRS